jgi:hypothetical protein
VFLDNRSELLGPRGSEAFERAVSVATSLGVAFARAGFAMHLATADARARAVGEEAFLEAMAGATLSQGHATADVLKGLRSGSLADTTLAFITAPPLGADLPSLLRLGTSFGRKLAVLVYPVAPAGLSAPGRADIEGRASAARASLTRAGWEVFVLAPDGRLGDIWQRTTKTLRVGASSFA